MTKQNLLLQPDCTVSVEKLLWNNITDTYTSDGTDPTSQTFIIQAWGSNLQLQYFAQKKN